MMKTYDAVRDELGKSMKEKLKDRPELRLKTFLYWKQRNLKEMSDGELSQEAGRASLAQGSSASYTPDYVPGVGSPRSLGLELERKRRKAGIPVEKITKVTEQLTKDWIEREVDE